MDSPAPETSQAEQPYESPTVVDLGSFAELTRGMTQTLTMDNGMASQA